MTYPQQLAETYEKALREIYDILAEQQDREMGPSIHPGIERCLADGNEALKVLVEAGIGHGIKKDAP